MGVTPVRIYTTYWTLIENWNVDTVNCSPYLKSHPLNCGVKPGVITNDDLTHLR